MDTWGYYDRQTTNRRTGEATTDRVLGQADAINKQRYERKGFTFVEYTTAPGVYPAIQACGVAGTSAGEQIFGFKAAEVNGELDDNEVVKQAAEVALRKMTGTWTQAEAVAEEAAHAMGEYKPRETPFAIVGGDVLEGYDALSGPNGPSTGSPSPGPMPTTAAAGEAGEPGKGAEAPRPRNRAARSDE